MSNFASRRLTILAGAALLVALVPVAPATGEQARVSVRPIMTAMGGVVVKGGSTLVRTRGGVFATIHATGLTEGVAYTAWFGFFQNPEFCATSPCTGADATNPDVDTSILNIGGLVAGADGAASVGGFRAVGDVTAPGGPPGTPNLGLLAPFKAEIHLVIRTHGPASGDPAVLQQQLSMFNGGCPPNTCMNLLASIYQP